VHQPFVLNFQNKPTNQEWVLNRMPEFDKHYLPPSVTVRGSSMLDDSLAFAVMADAAAPWTKSLPLGERQFLKVSRRSADSLICLPLYQYCARRTFYRMLVRVKHEASWWRCCWGFIHTQSNQDTNLLCHSWRPLFFAKFFSLVANASSTVEAMQALISPLWSASSAPVRHLCWGISLCFPRSPIALHCGQAFLNWSAHVWADYPVDPGQHVFQWSSSTNPPITAPSDFAQYGYSSCTGFATLLTFVARAVGIPARVAGTPCWNSGPFAGLATENPNVTQCWHGTLDFKKRP
jgi:hypothetical protein